MHPELFEKINCDILHVQVYFFVTDGQRTLLGLMLLAIQSFEKGFSERSFERCNQQPVYSHSRSRRDSR